MPSNLATAGRIVSIGVVALALAALTSLAPASSSRSDAGAALVFQRGELAVEPAIEEPTTLTFGPDGRLYIASRVEIRALTLDPATQAVLASEQVASGLEGVLGIAFDPTAPADPVVLYTSRQEPAATPGYQGVVSAFTAPSWEREDVITGLPSSEPHLNHLTNGLAFDGEGRLYIAQGSNTDAGIPGQVGMGPFWPETPLSAAILVADIHAPSFDGAITYSPAGPPTDDLVVRTGGDVAVFSPGHRNPFDLVVHSNGYIYATDNGALGGRTSLSCTEEGGRTSVADELNLVEEGEYYGFPNRNRGLGLPDPTQCVYRAPEDGPGPGDDFVAPIEVLPNHCSCNGIVEYAAATFGGVMAGDLIYVGLITGTVYRATLSADGRSVSVSTIAQGFNQPLDVTIGPHGELYIAEFTGNRISYLLPDSDGDGCSDGRELGPEETLGGRRDPENPWDFYDVNGDGTVNIVDDVLAVASAYGRAGEANYDAALDRSPAAANAYRWDMGPPDGAINVFDDVLGVALQVGHSCGT